MMAIWDDKTRADLIVNLADGSSLSLHTVVLSATCSNLQYLASGSSFDLSDTSTSVAKSLLQLAYGTSTLESVDDNQLGEAFAGSLFIGLSQAHQEMIQDRLLAELRTCTQQVYLENTKAIAHLFSGDDDNTAFVQKVVDITNNRSADISVVECPSLFALLEPQGEEKSAAALLESLEQASDLSIIEAILANVEEIPGNALWPLSFVAVGGGASAIVARLQDHVAQRYQSIPETDLSLLPTVITQPLMFMLLKELKKAPAPVQQAPTSQKTELIRIADNTDGAGEQAAARLANGEVICRGTFSLARGSTVSARSTYSGKFAEVEGSLISFASVELSVSKLWAVQAATRWTGDLQGAALAPIKATVQVGEFSHTGSINVYQTSAPSGFAEAAKNPSKVIQQTLALQLELPRTEWYKISPGASLEVKVTIHKL